MFLQVNGRVSRDVAGYEFRNVGQFDRDYRAGRFSAAFEEQNRAWEDAAIEKAQGRFGITHPRDILGREMDEEAKGRPSDEALEKHGPEIEAQIIRDLETMRKADTKDRQPSAPEPWHGRRGPDLDIDR